MIGYAGWITDPGRKRRLNEDAYVCEPPLFAIADGMGGARAGEVASKIAVAKSPASRTRGGRAAMPSTADETPPPSQSRGWAEKKRHISAVASRSCVV